MYTFTNYRVANLEPGEESRYPRMNAVSSDTLPVIQRLHKLPCNSQQEQSTALMTNTLQTTNGVVLDQDSSQASVKEPPSSQPVAGAFLYIFVYAI